MSLYSKTLLIITGILFALVVMIFVVSQQVFLSSYSQLETQNVQADIQRTLNAYSNELSQMSVQAGDYAHWDDTYGFVQQPDQQYLTSNYYPAALQGIRICFIAILDSKATVLFVRAIDIDKGESVPINAALNQILTAPNPIRDLDAAPNGRNGLLMTSDGPMLMASQQILTSELGGPSVGTLIMGRLLNGDWIQHLSTTLQMPVKLEAVHNPQLSGNLQTAQAAITTEHPIFVQPISSSQINGSSVINDLYGAPALMVSVDFPRRVYEQGQASLSFLMTILVAVSVIFTILMAVFLERLVLSRVRSLSHALGEVRASADMTRRMPIKGNDELANLARDINATLQALTQSQTALRQANEDLEKARVRERTAELSTTNLQLADEVANHKQTQAMLLQARDKAIEALNLKSRLLANMSHDSRTPLAVISLRTEMLQAGRYGPVTTKQIDVLSGILTSASQLLSFITNLLNESQLQARTMAVKLTPFLVKELVAVVNTTISPLAEGKGLSFKIAVSPDVPDTIMGDPERIRQMMTNLIHNAIKFTKQGGISVQIFCQDGQHWGIQVSDTGIGISPAALPHIFEPFWQVDGSTPLENGQGVGLGLSIVKELTTLMGGEVSVDSHPGQGSTFTILLPLQGVEDNPVSG